MLEDSLKSTRNIHRLIIFVSFVTLVFSLSIDAPQDTKKQKETIEALLEIDFLEYQDFVDSAVKRFEKEKLEPVRSHLETLIDGQNLRIFSLSKISDAFSQNIHKGQILIEELIFENLSSATINQLNTIDVLDIDADVQVIYPDTASEFFDYLVEYLNSSPSNARVEEVQLQIYDYDFSAETFIPSDTSLVSLYFELPETIRTGGAPVFNADFEAPVLKLKGTSLRNWITSKVNNKELVTESEGGLVWLPNIGKPTEGFEEQELGLVLKELKEKISKSSPEYQNISLLGASIPGVLFIYVSPLLILGLIYYLFNHVSHLKVLAPANQTGFNEFSWSPINKLIFWKVDLVLSIIALPAISLIVLYVRLSQFGSIPFFPSLIIGLSLISCIAIGSIIYRNIKVIREIIFNPLTK